MTITPEANKVWAEIDDIFHPRPHARMVAVVLTQADPTDSVLRGRLQRRAEHSKHIRLDRLRELLVNRYTFHANFQMDLLDRHPGGHAANKLTSARQPVNDPS